MSVHTSNVMATVENFNMSEIDLENPDANAVQEDRQQAEMQNIGEFVFNHITAETSGSCVKSTRRRVAIHSKCLIKS